MKALLPVYSRPLGYFIIALGLFMPLLMAMVGKVTDNNLLFYRECAKLLMMVGALMILFAQATNESVATEKIRTNAMRNAVFATVLYLFGMMLYRVWKNDLMSIDSSSFLIFLIINILCLEFGLKKAHVDQLFKGKKQ